MDEKKYTGGFENPEEGQENQQAGQNPNAAEHQETQVSVLRLWAYQRATR